MWGAGVLGVTGLSFEYLMALPLLFLLGVLMVPFL